MFVRSHLLALASTQSATLCMGTDKVEWAALQALPIWAKSTLFNHIFKSDKVPYVKADWVLKLFCSRVCVNNLS